MDRSSSGIEFHSLGNHHSKRSLGNVLSCRDRQNVLCPLSGVAGLQLQLNESV